MALVASFIGLTHLRHTKDDACIKTVYWIQEYNETDIKEFSFEEKGIVNGYCFLRCVCSPKHDLSEHVT